MIKLIVVLAHFETGMNNEVQIAYSINCFICIYQLKWGNLNIYAMASCWYMYTSPFIGEFSLLL